MPAPEPEISEQDRKKRTVWLLAGGAASLLLPLLGVFYLHWSATSGAQGPSGRNDVFERRDGGEKRIMPSQTAVPLAVPMTPPPSSLPAGGATERPAGSSLDFIKSNQEMSAKVNDAPKPAAAAAAPPAPAAAPADAAAPEAAAAPAKTKTKKGKKDFSMPKLQPSRGFTNFNSGKAGAAAAKGAPGGAPGGADAQDLLKNLPPGAENNPEVQKYLRQQQGK
jgi:hypothetical protein